MSAGVNSRIHAIRILSRWIEHDEFPDRAIAEVPSDERAFVMDITYTTVRWAQLLYRTISSMLKHDPPVNAQAALMLGACQILKMPEIPGYAAVHTTVEAFKQLEGRRSPHAMVNAILRNIERKRREILQETETLPLALRMSHPPGLVRDWIGRWGEERAAEICEWNNTPAQITITTLPYGPGREELLQRFGSAGISSRAHHGSADAIILDHGNRVEELPGFETGDFAIQDPSTVNAVRLLDVRPGMRVLDACAAPGGKAVRIAKLLQNRGSLVCLERHADRIPLLQSTLERLVPATDNNPLWKIRQGDAAGVTPDELGTPFDRILLDVPCSNTGVLRRRADARWRVSQKRTRKLIALQKAILNNSVNLLAPGGRIVYSTCSLQTSENEEMVQTFLEDHPDFCQLEQSFSIPPEMDGAFAAALSRNRES